MHMRKPWSIVVMLGIAQTLAWASSYYLPAILAVPMARDLGVAPSTVFAAFSAALIVAAACGPVAGRAIDRFGGRPVLIASNLVFSAGLAAIGQAQDTVQLFLAWAILGVAMGSGLYEAAFATVVRLQGQGARSAITGITLFAGFASTVGWPLSAALASRFGWRETCMAWAVLHLLVGLPLHLLLPRLPAAGAGPAPTPIAAPPAVSSMTPAVARRTAWLLAYVFAVTWFVSTAMAAHLPQVLQAAGVGFAAAVWAAALVGPAQVAGRVLEFSMLQRLHPLLSARIAVLAHPVAAAALLVLGAPAAVAFAILHGMGNGILTIAIGTLPLLLFGAAGYGQRQGWLMVPARIVQAGAPLLFGLGLARWGDAALWSTALLGLSACAALWWLRAPAPTPAEAVDRDPMR